MCSSGPVRIVVLLISCLLAAGGGAKAESISLAGRWAMALDPADRGVEGRWFERRLEGSIRLPGSLPEQAIGDPISLATPWTGGIVDRSFFEAPEYEAYRQSGHIKVPFWLQPDAYYAGPAWYQRRISIPTAWADKRISLVLERPHWETRAWLNGRSLGSNLSLSTPHEYDLGPLAPGNYQLTLRVDNRLVVDVGRDSHSVSDHTQGNWNGVVGTIELRAAPPVGISDLQLYPNATAKRLTIRGQIVASDSSPGKGTITLCVRPSSGESANRLLACSEPLAVSWSDGGGTFECDLALPAAQLWDEFTPNLYQAEVVLKTETQEPSLRTESFGFRDFATAGSQFAINGRKTFIRGTLECCIFPKTGHPPTDRESWRRLIRTAKAHGLNNLRFHSWCPPEAAFVAADELGMYLHVECASWANSSTSLGDGKPVDTWIYEEANRILRFYGNHPSFVMLLYGNEPGGAHHADFLSQWISYYRKVDPRRLYSGGAGWPQLRENQFHVSPDPRIQAWGGGLKSRINARPPETVTDYREYVAARAVPVVSHEIGQWCVYPNFDEIDKYTGYLKPRNFEIFWDLLKAHHLEAQSRAFLHASGKLQALCYKEEIESALRTPGMGGFQLLDLHDFPGQGTALVGVLDPFWEEKGYVTAAEFSRFCGPTVPLARLSKRVFRTDEELTAKFEVAHYGPVALTNVWPVYKLVADDGQAVITGHGAMQTISNGGLYPLLEWRPVLNSLAAPARYKLCLGLARDPEGRELLRVNEWDIWVYPAERTEQAAHVTIVRELTTQAVDQLQRGESLIWMLPSAQVAPDPKLGRVELGFSSIFWNTAWTRRQAPHTLGILCDPTHPLFRDFPTDSSTNWQWWYLVTRAGAMILDGLPADLLPTVQVIDDWFTARKLGLVFEAKVGPGALLVCSIDLDQDLDSNPVARQFRQSLVRYAESEAFKPSVEVPVDVLKRLSRGRE